MLDVAVHLMVTSCIMSVEMKSAMGPAVGEQLYIQLMGTKFAVAVLHMGQLFIRLMVTVFVKVTVHGEPS